MNFDKKIKNLSKEIDIPASYDERVEEILQMLAEQNEIAESTPESAKQIIPEKASKEKVSKEKISNKKHTGKIMFRLAVCLLCVIFVLSLSTIDAHANIFSAFKETILDFLRGGATEEDIQDIGVKSDTEYVESRPDLMMELQEKVIDSHSIYLLVKITAPANIKFAENILFDYFCFCKGTNYNTDQLLGGSISCELLEVNEDLPNVATYVVSLVFDENLEEGCDVTVCFKDLTADPYSDTPTLLVGGVWSITFPLYRTVTDNIRIEGNPDMVFSYINTTAELQSIELTPFGIIVLSDVSNFPSDELGISDTTIAIKLKMIDGSEQVIVSHDPDTRGFIQGGSISFSEVEEKTYQQDNLEFTNMINIGKVLGIYIEDLYVPIK